MGLDNKFDGMFVSCELGSRKPFTEFFTKAYQQLAPVSKSEILFYDDLAENVSAAKDFGFKAEHYHDFDSFQKGFKNHV
jgi:putative hydrolase of the HAD superfamily